MAGTDLMPRELAMGPEQSVIGSMLIDERVVGLVMAELTEKDFSMEINRVLFRAFRDLFTAGAVIDPVTVCEQASPGDVNLRRYTVELMDLTLTAANIREYMKAVRNATRMSRIRTIGRELYEAQDEAAALSLCRQGEELLSDQGRDDEADMRQATLNFNAELEHTPEYLPWGLPFLDKGLDVSGGKLIILGGRPSDGKTALALHMARTQARTKNVGFFTLEDTKEELYTRLMSATSRVRLRDIYRRELNEDSYAGIAGASQQLLPLRLRLIDATRWTVEEIAARTLQRKFDVIYIDYLQLIEVPARRYGTREEDVAGISRSLANLARRHGITVVALSQLSRAKEKDKRRMPNMADLRESGQIEQDANVIMFVWRKDESRSDAKRYLTVAKNKTGMLTTRTLNFQGDIQRFSGECSVEVRPKRQEPQYKQTTFEELPEDELIPFEEPPEGSTVQERGDPS